MVQRPAPREQQVVYPDGNARRAFEHGATVTFWDGDYAENLLARFWPVESCARVAFELEAA